MPLSLCSPGRKGYRNPKGMQKERILKSQGYAKRKDMEIPRVCEKKGYGNPKGMRKEGI
jgi:hypothetical protein